jgi:hypothetical protein
MRRTGAWACVAGGAALAVLTAVGWWLGPGTGPAYRVPEVIDPGPVQPDGEYDREFTIENRSDRPLTLVGYRTC